MKKKLVFVIACRNEGTRLFGKPLQLLDIENRITILDHLISIVKKINCVDDIIIAIADTDANRIYENIAKLNGIKFCYGSEENVLGRLVKGSNICFGTDVLRITSESPFPIFNLIEKCWKEHTANDYDASFLDNVIDGCGFEIVSTDALNLSNDKGEVRHRSEMCTLYIRENKNKFKINYIQSNKNYERYDLRLTVDNPEDLIVCREVYRRFKHKMPNYDLEDIIKFLDEREDLKKLIYPFTESGYKSLYL